MPDSTAYFSTGAIVHLLANPTDTLDVLQRVACQVSPLSRLGAGAQAVDAPVDNDADAHLLLGQLLVSRITGKVRTRPC